MARIRRNFDGKERPRLHLLRLHIVTRVGLKILEWVSIGFHHKVLLMQILLFFSQKYGDLWVGVENVCQLHDVLHGGVGEGLLHLGVESHLPLVLLLLGGQLGLVVHRHVHLPSLRPGLKLHLLLLVRGVQGDLIDVVDQGVPVEVSSGVLLAPVGSSDAGGHVLVVGVRCHLVDQVGQLPGKMCSEGKL